MTPSPPPTELLDELLDATDEAILALSRAMRSTADGEAADRYAETIARLDAAARTVRILRTPDFAAPGEPDHYAPQVFTHSLRTPDGQVIVESDGTIGDDERHEPDEDH